MKLLTVLLAVICGVQGQSTCTYPAECKLQIQAYSALSSAGCTDNNRGFLEVNGVRVWNAMWCTTDPAQNRRGVNTFLLDPDTCTVSDPRTFDTYNSASDADDLSAYIDYLDSDKILVGLTGDEPTQNLASARRLLRSAGLRIDDVQLRGSFAFVIYRGHPERTSFAKTIANTVSPNTKLSVTVAGVKRCRRNPCNNGAKCEQCGKSAICTCPAGWTGALCATANPCGLNPCKNGGACTNSGASFSCACTAGWTGADCATEQNPCLSGPCKNGGTCTATGATFTCGCIPGWAGNDCTTDVNVCLKGNPCLNGGTCVKFGDSYECKCAALWAGTNCDMGSAACKAVLPENRINCGWGGVTLAQCNGRSCCYDPMTGRPACFYAVDDCEAMDFSLRADCGFSGISYAQCLGRGCCFDDDETTNPGPICYRKDNPECIGVAAANRVAQGSAGIQPNECTAKGWCWDSSAVPNCFARAH